MKPRQEDSIGAQIAIALKQTKFVRRATEDPLLPPSFD
jgi:hypothetical protein